MSKTLKWALAAAGALALALALFLPRIGSDGETGQAGSPAGAIGAQTLTVEVARLEAETLWDRTVTTGSLLPNESVELRPEASGRLVEIRFTEGEPVRQGDLLARMNDDELQARLRQVQARRGLVEQREFRQGRLLEEGGVSREAYEETQGELDVLQADMDVLEAEIRRTEIRAPFDGVMGLRQVSPGSYLTPDRVVATLQEVDPLRLEFSLAVRYASRITRGSRVSFAVEGFGEGYEAEIYAIDPALEEDTRTLRVRARVPNPNHHLVPGAFARVDVVLEEIPGALMVPSIALRPSLEGPRLYVVRDGRAEAVPVETGLRTRDAVQILSGVEDGDRIVLTGFQQIRDGMEVETVEVEPDLPPEPGLGAPAEGPAAQEGNGG